MGGILSILRYYLELVINTTEADNKEVERKKTASDPTAKNWLQTCSVLTCHLG